MKKVVRFLLLITATVVILTSCNIAANDTVTNEIAPDVSCITEDENWLPICADGQIYIYHQYEEKILSYDPVSMQIASVNKQPNFYQFCFAKDNRIYTSGHSLTNNYSIISLHKDSFEKLLEFGAQESIFPLSSSEDTFIFIHTYYDEDGHEYVEQREICQLAYNSASKELPVYKNLTGLMITHGVCIGDILFFTAYIPSSNTYNLYSIGIGSLSDMPTLLEQELAAPELYEYNGELIKSTQSHIFINGDDYSKNSINYIIANSLIQIGPNEYGDLTFSATSLFDGEIYYTIDKIIDFRSEDEKTIILYGEGYINELSVR